MVAGRGITAIFPRIYARTAGMRRPPARALCLFSGCAEFSTAAATQISIVAAKTVRQKCMLSLSLAKPAMDFCAVSTDCEERAVAAKACQEGLA